MPRWLRYWATFTAASTFVLLVLGSIVSSFKVGMADPVWPTEPWKLWLIDWSEPSRGFLIEHTHRAVAFFVGALMIVLALGVWRSESRKLIRQGGLASLIALVVSFGYLHGSLIAQTKVTPPGTPLTLSPQVAAALALSLASVFVAAIATAFAHNAGWPARLLAVGLLIAVMIQGLMGGLRVHLDVMFGKPIAVIHASFSQVVFGLSVMLAMMGSSSAMRRPIPGIRIWALIAAVTVYLQIVAGAILRHLPSPAGPRLHLLLAFVSVVLLMAVSARMWATKYQRGLCAIMFIALTVQLTLGIESWLIRFSDGFFQSELRRITEYDALLRSAHAVVGYLIFGLSTAIAVRAVQSANSIVSSKHNAVLEEVA